MLALCCVYAAVKGGTPERIGAPSSWWARVLTTRCTFCTVRPIMDRSRSASFWSTLPRLLAFLALALRAERLWPLWVTALQVIGTAGHAVKLAGPGSDPRGLRFRDGVLELSDAVPAGFRHMEPPEAPGQVRCRQILVELLRPLGTAASDWADRLVAEFGSLAGTLAAAPAAQARALGDGAAAVRHLGIVRDAMLHSLRTEAFARPTLDDSQKLIDYLSLDMALLPTERLRVLFLNSSNRLLHDETHTHGSVSETPVYPREIMRRALEVGRHRPDPRPQPPLGRPHAEPRRRRGDAADRRGGAGARYLHPRPCHRRPIGLVELPGPGPAPAGEEELMRPEIRHYAAPRKSIMCPRGRIRGARNSFSKIRSSSGDSPAGVGATRRSVRSRFGRSRPVVAHRG